MYRCEYGRGGDCAPVPDDFCCLGDGGSQFSGAVVQMGSRASRRGLPLRAVNRRYRGVNIGGIGGWRAFTG